MQTQHHNTAMRNAFIFGEANAKEYHANVCSALAKGSGTRSKAIWAPLNPVAYNRDGLHDNDVVRIGRNRFTVAALARGVK